MFDLVMRQAGMEILCTLANCYCMCGSSFEQLWCRCNSLATLLTHPVTILRGCFTCVSGRLRTPVYAWESLVCDDLVHIYLTVWTHSLTNMFFSNLNFWMY